MFDDEVEEEAFVLDEEGPDEVDPDEWELSELDPGEAEEGEAFEELSALVLLSPVASVLLASVGCPLFSDWVVGSFILSE